MLIIAAALDALWGLAAILNDQVVTVGGQGVIVWDITDWGWFHLILGAILLVTAWGVATMQSWARWTAVGFATLSAITQVGVLPAFPQWSAKALLSTGGTLLVGGTISYARAATVPLIVAALIGTQLLRSLPGRSAEACHGDWRSRQA